MWFICLESLKQTSFCKDHLPQVGDKYRLTICPYIMKWIMANIKYFWISNRYLSYSPILGLSQFSRNLKLRLVAWLLNILFRKNLYFRKKRRKMCWLGHRYLLIGASFDLYCLYYINFQLISLKADDEICISKNVSISHNKLEFYWLVLFDSLRKYKYKKCT